MRQRTYSNLLGCAAVAALMASPPAWAQSAEDVPAEGGAEAQDGAAPNAGLGDIVVTAQRRSERLQNVPAAITAFSGDQLEALNIQSTKDLTKVTPGLNMTQSIYSPQPTIRGIGTRGVQAGDESVVPIYLDGVYQSFLNGLFTDLNSVERIEVLKGPQGALLGRNATGGAINIITRTPEEGFTGDFSLRYGRFDDVIAKAYVAAGTDTVGADVAMVFSRGDGYIVDDARDDAYGGRRNFAIRSKIVAHPSESFDLTLAGSYAHSRDNIGTGFLPINRDTIAARIPGAYVETRPYHASLSFDPFIKVRQKTVSLTGVYHGDGFDITAIGSYQDNWSHYLADADGSNVDLAVSDLTQFSRNSYNEVYIATNGSGPFNLTAGLVYYYDKAGYDPIRQVTTPVSAAGVIGTPNTIFFRNAVTTNSYAAYAQGTYDFDDKLSLTVGGRYTIDKKAFLSKIGQTTITSILSARNRVNKFTPTGTLKYQVNPDLNIYVKAGQAFKAGLANMAALSPSAATFVRPETVTQYEFGVKSDITRDFRVNASVYYTRYKDLQTQARDPLNPGLALLQNAGGAELYGFEIEAVLRPVERLNLQASLSALHAKYTSFPSAQVLIPSTAVNPVPPANVCVLGTGPLIGGNRSAFCDVSGNKLTRTPFVQANFNANYSIPVSGDSDLLISGGVSYQGASYWDTYNRVREPAYTLVDLRLMYRFSDERFQIGLWGENLTNERYRLTTNISANLDGEVLAKPRTYGVEFKASF